jgi:ubiquinone/menaquinone biosynthesis C-methylase UbiE
MFTCEANSVYESKDIRNITGDTIRPGGLALTNKALDICKFKENARVLDVGCGLGTTAAYLKNEHNLNAVGIDPSEKLLKEARVKYPELEFYEGRGEKILFESNTMEGVFCECTLSLMTSKEKAIEEIFRVLKKDGYLVISDVYAREPRYVTNLNKFNINTCIRGVHDIAKLKTMLREKGFEIKYFHDYTDYLKQMMVEIIFRFGSMSIFWNKTSKCSMDCREFKESLAKCKIGYFQLIVQKIIE